MVTPLASRFAVLPVDDDGDTSKRITAKSLRKKEQTKPVENGGTKVELKKKQNKKKPDQPSTSKPSKSKSKGETKKKGSHDDWELWQKKDAELVDGNYADDLQQAMLLSKLDFEEKKEYYDQIKKAAEEEKKGGAKKNKKSNKAQTLSLSQFNQLSTNDNENQTSGADVGAGDSSIVNGKPESDPEFFDRVKSEAKKALQSEQAEEQRKAREPFIDDMISMAQLQARLEERDEEISRLRTENENLQKELGHVKSRNKKLCQILLQGEMKDKAEVLVEVDKLQRVRDELSSEVSSLAAQLEQEKSKVRALTGGDAKAKDKNKKRTDSK